MKFFNQNHIDYLEGKSGDGGFPAELQWNDEQKYLNAIRFNDAADLDSNGSVWSTSNP